ncbi:type I Zorya anti-phage system protein ZorC [Dickeya fangzhongdai]|uniref:type I Zorya anti-phage system protein ZorC n=1 Tax=Dickeya fangzhongdai TaxID=1778540 RepID=UPI0026E014B5|nr:type I Zorya anti-phage system protein ZorC [Dickeya fangzhongdai]WKV50258.1 EH signature domain-containing protein [Dickeya fangzhongdai]
MISALSRLSSEVAATVKRHIDTEATAFGDFPKLRAAEQYLAVKMEKSERTTVPPLTKRLKAIAALRQLKVLTRYDWQLIFAGLADSAPDAAFPVLLEDDSLYSRVEQEIQQRIDRKKLKRREWKFLCSSYFGYHAKKPDENNNWCSLRDQLRIGYGVIKGQVRREKRWMAVIDEYQDLFTPDAGNLLANKMSAGELVDFSALETVAQVPDDSWLWYRAFVVLLAKILELNDEAFKERLPHLLELARQRERYKNIILRACLTQYYRSSLRNIPHPQLKQMVLESWGSPQLRSKQNLWLTHLKDPDTSEKICRMVRSWLAKEDLTHFFQLLKGNGDVDQARLFYWLRFANQMGFTRIVMGQDARHNMHSDFVAFRQKNKGRLSNLSGGTSADNAVIMQIGNYLFVEFSRTGNALYVYELSSAPFNPEKSELHLNDELKVGTVKHRHAPTASDYSDNYLTGWMINYEDELRKLGIKYQPSDMYVSPSPSTTSTISPHSVDEPQRSTVKETREQEIRSLLKQLNATVNDKRNIGGALHIRLLSHNTRDIEKLIRLGFKQKNGDPLTFWSK